MFFPETKPYSLLGRLTKTQRYLDRNSKQWFAETSYDASIRFKDNFVELLMLEATGNWNLVDLRIPQRKWNYFGSKAVVTPDPYPEENDTNALAPTIIKPVDSTAHSIMDEMLKCENEAGIIQLYDDPSRPRIVPEVSANILTFFYTYGRGHQVQKSLEWVYSVLSDRQYHPSRYYLTPEPLFYYLMRLINASDAPELEKIKRLLIIRLKERIGSTTDNSVFLAIRLLVCQRFNIPNYADLNALLNLQEEDGGFGVGWYYKFGRSQAMIGHRGLTAALSLEAIKGALMGNMFDNPANHIQESAPDIELAAKNGEVEKSNGEANGINAEQTYVNCDAKPNGQEAESEIGSSQADGVNGVNGHSSNPEPETEKPNEQTYVNGHAKPNGQEAESEVGSSQPDGVNGVNGHPSNPEPETEKPNEQVRLGGEETGAKLGEVQVNGKERPNGKSSAQEFSNGSTNELDNGLDIESPLKNELVNGAHELGKTES